MKYAFVLVLILTVACKREKLELKNDTPISRIVDHYQLREEQPHVSRLKNAFSNERLYSQIKNELDFSGVQFFRSLKDNSSIYIIGFKKNPNKKYAIRAVMRKRLQITDEILYSRKMVDQRNGNVGILKNSEALMFNFSNGMKTVSELTDDEFKIQFAKEVEPFCQRKPGQSFKDCYNQETDEFCDSFVSCVALATNPTVSVLIAIACSCYPD